MSTHVYMCLLVQFCCTVNLVQHALFLLSWLRLQSLSSFAYEKTCVSPCLPCLGVVTFGLFVLSPGFSLPPIPVEELHAS